MPSSEKKQDRKHLWLTWIFPIGGLLALIWFMLRVIPKPSRATYPCQRAAFPLASGFMIWLVGAIGSIAAFRKAKRCLAQSRYVLCVVLLAASIGSVWLAQSFTVEDVVFAEEPAANAPVGTAKGIHPGRVVWIHDPDATDWDGPGSGHWWESSHTDQAAVDRMMGRAVRTLTGEAADAAAWNRLFEHFNKVRGKGGVGYKPGEKIVVKVNFVGCIRIWRGRDVADAADYDLRSVDYMNTSPQMIIALLRQLVNEAGVSEADITVGDTLCYFPNEFYEMCHEEFPDVRYMEYLGKFGRTAAKLSSVPFHWSTPDAAGKTTDYVPESYVRADYLINLANLKSHNDLAGITLCAKNHYGSLVRKPSRTPDHYDMHKDLPRNKPGMGHYRPLVDLMGHKHTGGKTLLYLIDGLYAGKHAKERAPRKWNSAPFNGDWSSSLFASQDPVAIDSVGFDFLWTEWDDAPHWSGTSDYLIEAAMADDPPSGAFYDPDHEGSVTRLASLGVYEHWNNPADKQYSRNLGTGDGIELVKLTGAASHMVGVAVSGATRQTYP
ncbi:MAG: hypothetical protein CEE38_04660 [Planctomycetes bacterium B3_Pla]|nr:MAG: hypothetical protein CEE38_04660 [Planctomycetes bacterium B3_Pla]